MTDLNRPHHYPKALSERAQSKISKASAPEVLWYSRCPVPTPLGLAARLGWFEQEFRADAITIQAVPDLLDSLWRHLPEQDETQQAMTKALDDEHPLKNLDEAIEALVFDVVDLAQIGLAESHKVETVIREHPKLGRNDPCHCGSGKKFKKCHGA